MTRTKQALAAHAVSSTRASPKRREGAVVREKAAPAAAPPGAPPGALVAWIKVVPVAAALLLVLCHVLTAPGSDGFLRHGAVQRALALANVRDADVLALAVRVHAATSACLLLSGSVPRSASDAVAAAPAWLWARISGEAQCAWPTMSRVYKRDPRDLLFVFAWSIILLAVRIVAIDFVLVPLGRRLVSRVADDAPQRRAKRVNRFAEQVWIVIIYTLSFVLVTFVAVHEPFWPNKSAQLWAGYPHAMNAATKAVYLWEASNYLHQVLVIHMEAKRSDYLQMFTHHIVTLMLIGASYVCNFHRVGIVILFLLDPSDILLGLAKVIRYMGLQTLCDILFGLFMLTWTVNRHVLYMAVLYSCVFEAPQHIPYRHPVDWRSGYVFTENTYYTFIALLCLLQALLLVWYSMILGVAYRVLTNHGATDSRSDDDE